MSALVRLHVDAPCDARIVRLPELPTPGDLIHLVDGTHVTVREIERNRTGIVVADIRAEPVSKKPQAHARRPRRGYLARLRPAVEQ